MKLARRDLLSGAAAGTIAQALTPLRSARADGTPTPKRGGILKIFHPDNPASMSILEETTTSVVVPMMGVFNNLIVFDQHVPRNSMQSIVPDLATEWSWSDGGKQLTFKLREGVVWHDGTPFTAADVAYTWDLIQVRGTGRLRINPRRPWYVNVESVTAQGDHEVVFRLTRPQPALLVLLSAGPSAIYPRHIPPQDMRSHPIGTGPFKFVEYRRGEGIKLERNPNYWKPGRPYLDGVEYSIVPSRPTAILGFTSGRFDMTFPSQVSIPLIKDVQSQSPDVMYQIVPTNVAANVCLNHTAPPFDNADLRRAVSLTIDRGEFIRILTDGHGLIGGAMLPPPAGVWGLPPEALATLPGYNSDVEARRNEARKIMAGLGYGPDKRLEVAVSTRNVAGYRDPAVIFTDQLKRIWIDATLQTVETAVWDATMIRRNYTIGINQTGGAVDDPDVQFFENYACHSTRNFTGYCNPEIEKLFLAQSIEMDQVKRQDLVWQIDKQLQEEVARPIIMHNQAATCWHPHVKGLTLTVNSVYNGWRMEDVWLDV